MKIILRRRLTSYPTTAASRKLEAQRISMLKAVLSSPDDFVDLMDNDGFNALMHAASQGYEEDVRLILETGGIKTSTKQVSNYPHRSINGVKRGVREKFGDTALTMAARRGHFGVIKLLVEEGRADVNIPGFDGMTALTWAVCNNREDIVLYLLDRGANVNMQCDYGQTALFWSVDKGYSHSLLLLLFFRPLSLHYCVSISNMRLRLSYFRF
jgi:ankyrin repeat protein